MPLEKKAFLERARSIGINLNRAPSPKVVVTGYAQRTPLGNTELTWDGMMSGQSGVKPLGKDFQNDFTRIGAPLPEDYDPVSLLDEKERDGISPITAMAIDTAREAGEMAGLLDKDHKLDTNRFDRTRAGTGVSSGYGASQKIIDIYKTLHERVNPKTGEVNIRDNSRRISLYEAIQTFPEQLNGDVARLLSLSGWGQNSSEACATGLSNIIDMAKLIRMGVLDVAFAGGFEMLLHDHSEVTLATFSSFRKALSKRNDDPATASRPFDLDRDGFVIGEGGGVIVLEREDHALKRGANILAEFKGFAKSMDGKDKTLLDPNRVAGTIMEAQYDTETGTISPVDTVFAHATATKPGDLLEKTALAKVFEDELREKIITAVKSYYGHLLGGAGAVNVVAAIQAIQKGKIPPVINIENLDPDFADLTLVRDAPLTYHIMNALVVAYGFGGYNAAGIFSRYN